MFPSCHWGDFTSVHNKLMPGLSQEMEEGFLGEEKLNFLPLSCESFPLTGLPQEIHISTSHSQAGLWFSILLSLPFNEPHPLLSEKKVLNHCCALCSQQTILHHHQPDTSQAGLGFQPPGSQHVPPTAPGNQSRSCCAQQTWALCSGSKIHLSATARHALQHFTSARFKPSLNPAASALELVLKTE